MKSKPYEEYCYLYCDWCDSGNLILRSRLNDGPNCGACQRPLNTADMDSKAVSSPAPPEYAAQSA